MRIRFYCFAGVAFCFLQARSQDTLSWHFAKTITDESFHPILNVLASDSLEGRETGTPGQKKAAAYIAGHFRSAGLKPAVAGGYFQYFNLTARATAGKNFCVNQKYYVFMRDYFYPSAPADSLFLLNEIAFAGYGISTPGYDDYARLNVKGKPVMIFEGGPSYRKTGIREGDWSAERKINTAIQKGASLVLVVTDSIESIGARYLYTARPGTAQPFFFAFITREAARSFFPEIQDEMAEKTLKKISRTGKPGSFLVSSDAQLSFLKNTDALHGENVLGYLEGTDKKNEVVVLTAHYDHLGVRDTLIYHGADDDASGTSAVMEMAKVFADAAALGYRPRRSILFMTLSGEEKGLLGSKFYVRHPAFPLEQTVADLNTDMIGRTDEKHDSLKVREYVYIIGSDKLSTTLHRINEDLNARYTKLALDYTFNRPDDPNRYYTRSDHYNFAKNNIPVIFYFNGSHADYHKPTDTIDKIQFDLLTKRTRLIFLTAWELANRADRLAIDVVSDMPGRSDE